MRPKGTAPLGKRANAIAIALTPALSFGTLAVALGLGANSETLAAVVYGAPPGSSRSGLAWQVDVMFEDRGVREIKPNLPITVHAVWKDQSRDWSGVTTTDGAAEVPLDFSGANSGDDVDIIITTDDAQKKVLARGRARVPESIIGRGSITRGAIPPLHRDGAIVIDVAILGGALAAEFPSELWIRARDKDGNAISGAQAHLDSVDGLVVASNDVSTCDAGWAKLLVTARALSANATIRLKSGAFVGSWTGALPIVLGATRALVTEDDAGNLHASVARPLVTKSVAYVEVDDDVGRVFAAAVPLVASQNDFTSAQIDLPKLTSGNVWIVSGSGPRAAETMSTGTFAIPFFVGKKNGDACGNSGELATEHAAGFARTLALDGFLEARKISAERRHRGMTIAFASLILGALVEAILLIRAARSGSNVRSAEDASWITRAPGAIAIGIGMSLLGFALLAAFVATH
jgi:hypothetical protein